MPSYAYAPLAAHAALGMGTLCCVSMELYFVDNVDIVKDLPGREEVTFKSTSPETNI